VWWRKTSGLIISGHLTVCSQAISLVEQAESTAAYSTNVF
jgi:hypothetical protein